MNRHPKTSCDQLSVIVLTVVTLSATAGTLLAQDVAHYVGTNSCAAANCHGGDGSGPRWTSSYSDWVQRDKHARAYTVLLGERSRRMVRALRYKQPAHEAVTCLNCHALPPVSGGRPGHDQRLATDGVSCESCHGPASLWIARHVRSDWPRVKLVQAADLSFYDTDDVRMRTRACTGCHVGGPGRDVNHDLIAAGHPRLNFEMSAYHANLPRHWDDSADRKRHAGRPDSADGTLRELKLWAVGQVETLRARAELSRWRAASTGSAPWPELAETRCFSCHHDLRDARWRRPTEKEKRRPDWSLGQFRWSRWERSMIESLLPIDSTVPAAELTTVLDNVDKLTLSVVVPDRDRMKTETAALAAQLDKWSVALNQRTFNVKDLDGLARRLVAESESHRGPVDWDQAAQLYLALSSFQVSQKEATGLTGERRQAVDRALSGALSRMRDVLRFPNGHDSAAQLRGPGADVDTPPVALEQFDRAIRVIRSALNDSDGAK